MSIPAWKLRFCPCGNTADLFYYGEKVPMQGYAIEQNKKGIKLSVTIYGNNMELKDFYIAKYKEEPYSDILDTQSNKV